MRILDRYLLRGFCVPAMYCLDAFALLWIVLDLFGSLDQFLEHHTSLAKVARYYVVMFPGAFVQLVPMSLLLGLLFFLSQLSKHNEVIAMRSSGIGVGRLALPLLAVGLVATLVVFGANEWLVPHAQERSHSLLRAFRGKGEENVVANFFYSNALEHRDWYARRFNTQTRELDNPEIHERHPDGSQLREIFAEKARWLQGQWVFYNVDIYQPPAPGVPGLQHFAETNFPSLTERPGRLVLEARKPEEMTTAELRRFINSPQQSRRSAQLAPCEVALQYRYAFPLTCLVVVWIGIPLGLSHSRSGALLGVASALGLIVAFYFLSHITQMLGSGGQLPPLLAAWLPNLLFTAVGGVLLWRVR